MDSVSGVEFIHAINRAFSLHLDASIVYDYIHLESLSQHVAQLVCKNRSLAPTMSVNPVPPPVDSPDSGNGPVRLQLRKVSADPTTGTVPAAPTTLTPLGSVAEISAPSETPRLDPVEKQVTGTSFQASMPLEIAIIGMSCRLPGAPDIAAFWRNLADGVDSVTEPPKERWDIEQFFDPDPDAEGKTYCKQGGFINDVDRFDPLFFNLSHAEAEVMDPQQRLFLEESWKAFEHAGYSPRSLSNRKCGVFVGASVGEYSSILRRENPVQANSAFAGIGLTPSILAARISYLLNLKGPALALDTACSSSLVALHQACQSLYLGECEMALAGGINVMLNPDQLITTSKMRMLSPEGRCRSFDHRANGIALSEGVAIVVVKPLEQALRDGDHVYGVIKGSGINQDGKTNGITAPSAISQAELEKEVYRRAGVDPESFGMVEAHGTGLVALRTSQRTHPLRGQSVLREHAIATLELRGRKTTARGG